MSKIGVIGGGNMGEAIISRVQKSHTVLLNEQDAEKGARLEKVYQIKNLGLEELVKESSVLIIAVKPQDFEGVLKEISKYDLKNKLLISIAAGITTSYIEKLAGSEVKVVRTMPNMPAMVGRGVTAICAGTHAKDSDLKTACEIFYHVGKTVIIKEHLMDAVTAVSGSGPAYFLLFIELLIKSAKQLGLKEELRRELVISTFLGCAHLLEQKAFDPVELRTKVTSKGGTTEAAIDVLLKSKLEEIFTKALLSAEKRARELSKE